MNSKIRKTELDVNTRTCLGSLRNVDKVGLTATDVALDFGANVCFIANYMAATGAKVYAFEPLPPAHAAAEPAKGVKLFHAGVTADGRTIEMAVATASLERGYLCTAHTMDERRQRSKKTFFAGIKTYAARKLEERYQPTFIKCDTEGAEYEIIPALRLDTVRALAVEFHGAQGKRQSRDFARCAKHIMDAGLMPVTGWPKRLDIYPKGGLSGIHYYCDMLFMRGADRPTNYDFIAAYAQGESNESAD